MTDEKMRAALQAIADSFTPKHQAALDRWEGSGTAAFEDPEWMDANTIKPLAEMAKAALAIPAPEKAKTIPLEYSNMQINCGRDGVWLHFSASTGRRASLHVGNLAERQGSIIGSALHDWCADIERAAEPSPPIKSRNGEEG